MTDRFERRRHRQDQEPLEVPAKPASSEGEPSPSATPIGGEGSWHPIDEAPSDITLTVRSVEGKIMSARSIMSRFFNTETLRWQPKRIWRLTFGGQLPFEPVEYFVDH